jgi:Sulfotransferase family
MPQTTERALESTTGAGRAVEICPDPVFIIGSPRSGTTILARSLGEHSDFWTSDESIFIHLLFGEGRAPRAYERAITGPRRSWLRAQDVDEDEFLAALGVGVNALFTSRSCGRRWIDQTPLYTRMAPELARLFPGALFIHLLRDGRRVVHSMTHFLDRRSADAREALRGTKGPKWWAHDFGSACRTWSEFASAGMAFCREYPGRSLTVVHERLVGDPADGFRRILRFLGVEQEEGPADFFGTHCVNSSFRGDGLLSPSSPSEPWRGWGPEQRARFAAEAGATLVAAGLASENELARWAGDGEARPGYDALVRDVREAVRQAMPRGATVLIVSSGDERFLDIEGRNAWHFPRDPAGHYAGHHPRDDAEAIGHLEELRARGAAFLVVPDTERWWLDEYEGLRQLLERRYRVVADDERCLVVAL